MSLGEGEGEGEVLCIDVIAENRLGGGMSIFGKFEIPIVLMCNGLL
jgi:hypothetical protein